MLSGRPAPPGGRSTGCGSSREASLALFGRKREPEASRPADDGLCREASGELGRLQVTDIDSARMCLRIDQGKGNKDRYVPLSPRLLEQLREYWRRDRPQHLLFPGRPLDRPMHRSTPALIFHNAKDKAGIRKAGGIHSLRHA